MDHKEFTLSLKADDGADLVGYFSTFSRTPDRVGDIIAPGAFVGLDEFVKSGLIFFNHDMNSVPIGYPTSAIQDRHGLKVAANLHNSPEAQKVRTMAKERLAAGKQVSCSIGYKTLDEGPETVGGRRVNVLRKLQLFECSIVNVPANPEAGLIAVKASDGSRDQGRSPEFWQWVARVAGRGPIEQNDVEMLHTLWLSGQRMPGDNPYVARQGQTWRGDVAPGVAAGNGTLPPGKGAAIRLRVALLRADLAISRAKLQAR